MAKRKRKIETKAPPRTPHRGLDQPKIVKTPRRVLAEFREHARSPLTLTALPAPCGPSIRGYKCMASWSVHVSDEEVLEYLETAEEIGNVKRLFHGTPTQNVASIAQEGLRKGRGYCMFGSGIYFGALEKALGYARGDKAQYVFECEVALGTCEVASEAKKYTLRELNTLGCHSVHGKQYHTKSWRGTLLHDEYVIYSSSQILIDKIHEYQQTVKYLQPPTPQHGSCNLIVEKTPVLNRHNRAFKDILSRQQCEKKAYVRLDTTKGVFWACNSCIEEQRLRVGSPVEVKDPDRWSRTPIIKARIKREM